MAWVPHSRISHCQYNIGLKGLSFKAGFKVGFSDAHDDNLLEDKKKWDNRGGFDLRFRYVHGKRV